MVVFSQCMDCKNYIGKKGDAFCCKAFPEGIPGDIFWNKKYHIEHIDGDNGYLERPSRNGASFNCKEIL